MRITTFSPSVALAPFVEKLSIVESEVEVTRSLLPELGVIVGVRFAGAAHLGNARLPDATITGVQTRNRSMRTLARSGIVLAHFRPGGASACFQRPMHELLGATLELAALLGRAPVATLADRIGSADSHARRATILDAALVAHARQRHAFSPDVRSGLGTNDALAAAAMRAIETARGSVRIATLARDLAITQDPLEKRFRAAIGASPKYVARLVRIRHAIARAASAPTDLARIALEAGYYDQSHFNREFRALTGESPVKFLRAAAYC